MGKRILVIDDEQMTLDAIEVILEDMGHEVTCCSDALEGEKEALENDYDLYLIDIHMPETDGASITKNIINKRPNAAVLIITAYPNDPLAKRALGVGAKGLVKKPFEIGKILIYLQE